MTRNKKSKVSVVIATYNGSRYIIEQLKSICEQSVKLDEIVLIDDCSGDNTYEIAKEFISERFEGEKKILRHKKNCGYKYTFYEAIFLATGDVIFLSDQDDIWCENKVQYMMKHMEKENVLALNTSNFLINENGQLISSFLKKTQCLKRHIPLKKVLQYNISMGCTMAISAELKKELGNWKELSELSIPHDWLINIMAAKKDGLYYSNKKTIYYRLHSNNTLGLKRSSDIKSRVFAYDDMIKHREAMKRVLMLSCYNDEKTTKYLEEMISSYELRIEALEKLSMSLYIKGIISKKLLRYCNFLSMGYDLKLITNEKMGDKSW